MQCIAPMKAGVRGPTWVPRRPSLPPRRRAYLRVQASDAPPELPPDIITRQYRRTVYDFGLWAKHRDVNRYLRNLNTLPGSRIIRTLFTPMGYILAWASLYGFYETCLESGVLPSYLPNLKLASAEPQGLTSFALSLLLVFRTNSSYGRFDEARKIWGGILNRARNIANQAVTFVPPEDKAGREAVGKWTVGFCRALQAHLQEDANLRAELEKAQPRWTKEEIDILVSAQHRPIKAISMLSELTRQLPITQFQALQMQENVTFFYDALGGCERLLRTPIPVSYTRHTARFLTIWLALLPVGLWDRYHWSMLPVIALIGFLLLGIDEIGVQIEEPFGILPLDAICTRAQTDVVSLIKDDKDVVKYVEDYREGRIKPPTTTLPVPPPPAPAAVAGGAAGSRSPSPGPGVVATMTSMLKNVQMGVGAVAAGAPTPPPRASSPRTRSPARSPSVSRTGSPTRGTVNFPPASAGTGLAAARAPPPPPVAAPAAAAPKAKPVAQPAASGFSLPSLPAMPSIPNLSGLAGSASAMAKSAASNMSKMATNVTAGDAAKPAAPPPPPPAAAAAAATPKPAAAMPAVPPTAASNGAAFSRPAPSSPASSNGSNGSSIRSASGSSSPASADQQPVRSASGSSIRGTNWREELAAMKAARGSFGGDDEETAARGAGGDSGSEADEEAMRRFGNLAGRSRSGASVRRNGNGNGNGNGSDGDSDGEGSRARPRTRPDWRSQL